jgi:hypothetical protein
LAPVLLAMVEDRLFRLFLPLARGFHLGGKLIYVAIL